jgi:hypothetical protein
MASSSTITLNSVGYKVDIDDTLPLSCTFEATETSSDHIVRKRDSYFSVKIIFDFLLGIYYTCSTRL